jgi:tetratricopeptide (TPR) repeat protein
MKHGISVSILLLLSGFPLLPDSNLSNQSPDVVDKPKLAVVCFHNGTGDDNLEYLRYGFPELLTVDLCQSKYLNVLEEEMIHKISGVLNPLDDEKHFFNNLFKISNQYKVDHILFGDYDKSDEDLVVSARLWNSDSGEVTWISAGSTPNEYSIPSLVDRLTREVKIALNLTRKQINDDLDKRLDKITTAAPGAFRHYVEGRRCWYNGRVQEARSFYEKAVAIDPGFALAYWKMAMTFPGQKLSSYSKKAKALSTALEHPDRLSTRVYYWILGDYHSMTRYRYAEALEACRKLLEIYPGDYEGRRDLGFLYFDLEEWEKAASQFRMLIEDNHESPEICLNLALSLQNPGLFDEAETILESALNRFGDNLNIYLTLALNLRFLGKYDQAHRIIDRAISRYPKEAACYAGKGDIYLYSGELDKAGEVYRTLLENEASEFHDLGLSRLAELYLMRGNFKDAGDLAEQSSERARQSGSKAMIRDSLSFAARLDFLNGLFQEAMDKWDLLWKTTLVDEELEWQRFIVYMKGLVFAETGEIEKAIKEGKKLKDLIGRGLDKKKKRLYLHLMGVIELKRNRPREAAGYLEESRRMTCARSRLNIAVADSLALAYFKMGDLDRAQKEYERMAAFPRGRQFYGDIYARSFYRIGEIFLKKGINDEAVKNFKRFLELWKDSSPAFPEVENATDMLRELKVRK